MSINPAQLQAQNNQVKVALQDAGEEESSTGDVRIFQSDPTRKLRGHFDELVPESYPELSEEEALNRLRDGQPIERCYIRRLNLTGEFDKTLLLREVYINHLAISEGTFLQNLSLQGCRIRRTYISKSSFKRALSFKHSELHFLHFDENICEQGLNAESIKASSKVLLTRSIFRGRVRFWEAQFQDWVTLEKSEFHHRLDMRSAHLNAGLTAPGSHFHEEVLFRGTHIAMKWEAIGARFDGLVDFSKAKLNDFVYLEEIEQGEKQMWAFWNTVSERIVIRPDQIEGRLKSEEEGQYETAMREYGVLKHSFEHGNLYARDDWAFYRFKVNERRARGASWTRPVSKVMELLDWFFLDWGCGYGTHPGRAIRTALVLIVFFAGLYTLGADQLHKPENLPFPEMPADSFLNRASTSLFVSLAAFTSGFGDLRGVAMGWLNVPIMLEALLGTMMWGLFVVAFGRKVIR